MIWALVEKTTSVFCIISSLAEIEIPIPGSPQPVASTRQRTFSSTSQRSRSGSHRPALHQQTSVVSGSSETEDRKQAGMFIAIKESCRGRGILCVEFK